MTIKKFIFGCLLVFVLNGSVLADEGHHKPYKGSPAFEKMKSLVGEWEGTMNMGPETHKFTASYHLTSADSALVETIFAGSPQEMVNIFHDDSKKNLTLVHYCAAHNQPKLVIQKAEANRFELDLASDADIDVHQDGHMHALTIEFDGPDKMIQEWTSFESGKAKDSVKMVYTRKKS